MRRAIGTAACGLAALALLTSCKGGGKGKTASTTGKPTSLIVQGFHVLAVLDIHETEYKLQPKTIGLEVPGYFGIRAINDGTIPHALAVAGHGVSRRTPIIQPHESSTIAVYFRKPGVYKLYCPLDGHRGRGMTATLRVR